MGIELGEVDGFRDFRVGLREDLAGSGDGRTDEVAAGPADFVGRRTEYAVAPAERHGPPPVRVGLGRGHRPLRIPGGGQGAAGHDHGFGQLVGVAGPERLAAPLQIFSRNHHRHLLRLVPRCFHPRAADALGPGAVGRKRPVGVRFVAELARGVGPAAGGQGLGDPVLGAVGLRADGRHASHRCPETIRQHLPGGGPGLQPVQVAQEVPGAGVLVQPPDEVGDGIDEVPVFGDRCVGEQVLSGFLHGAPHVVRHALDHFEGEKFRHLVAAGQLVGKGDVEEVVGGDPEAHGADVVRRKSIGDHALPVGIHVEFVVVGGERPAAERGLEQFHLHVGALDDAHLDRAAAGIHPASGPGGDLLQHAEGVRQIGLERHAGKDIPELRPVQRAHEGGRRQRQVAVGLHVECYGLGEAGAVRACVRLGRGFAVEHRQAFRYAVDRLGEGQGMDLGADGGDLDGDALDRRVSQVGKVGVHVGERLLLPEDLLAQMIHVDPQAFRPPLLQVGAERCVLPGDDGVAAVGPHFRDDAGHGVGRQETTERAKTAESALFRRRRKSAGCRETRAGDGSDPRRGACPGTGSTGR